MRYCIVVPIFTDRYNYFYSGLSGFIDCGPAMRQACVFEKLPEAKEATKDINRRMKRDAPGVDPRMLCYVTEWSPDGNQREAIDREAGIFPRKVG